MVKEFEKVYELVEDILKKYPECRDDDKALYLRVLFHHGLVEKLGQYECNQLWSFMLNRFEHVPCPESTSRARRHIQNRNILARGARYWERKKRAQEMHDHLSV